MIEEVLQDTIDITWHYQDVIDCTRLSQDKGDEYDYVMSDEHARRVLFYLKHYHDANMGINWDVIEAVAEMLRSEGEII